MIYVNRLPDTISPKNEVSRWHITSRERSQAGRVPGTRPRPVQAPCQAANGNQGPLSRWLQEEYPALLRGSRSGHRRGGVGRRGSHRPRHRTAQPGRRSRGAGTEASLWGGSLAAEGLSRATPGGRGGVNRGDGPLQTGHSGHRGPEETLKTPRNRQKKLLVNFSKLHITHTSKLLFPVPGAWTQTSFSFP